MISISKPRSKPKYLSAPKHPNRNLAKDSKGSLNLLRINCVLLTSLHSQRGSIAPDGCQIIGQSTENQPAHSRKHIHSLFDLKTPFYQLRTFSETGRCVCSYLCNAGAQIFQSSPLIALREYIRKAVISHPLDSITPEPYIYGLNRTSLRAPVPFLFLDIHQTS